MPDPRVIGATPLDPGLRSEHPCRGASFATLHNELSGFSNAQMRQPWGGAGMGLDMCGISRTFAPQSKGGKTYRGVEQW